MPETDSKTHQVPIVMARHPQRQGTKHGENHPAQAGDDEGLAPIERGELDLREKQDAPHDARDADGEQEVDCRRELGEAGGT